MPPSPRGSACDKVQPLGGLVTTEVPLQQHARPASIVGHQRGIETLYTVAARGKSSQSAVSTAAIHHHHDALGSVADGSRSWAMNKVMRFCRSVSRFMICAWTETSSAEDHGSSQAMKLGCIASAGDADALLPPMLLVTCG